MEFAGRGEGEERAVRGGKNIQHGTHGSLFRFRLEGVVVGAGCKGEGRDMKEGVEGV